MKNPRMSIPGAFVGAISGWVAEVAIQEITGHHIATGLLEIVGAAAGLWRLDKRASNYLRDTLDEARTGPQEDYREVKRRIDELTQDLPELRDILQNMVDAGIQAQQA